MFVVPWTSFPPRGRARVLEFTPVPVKFKVRGSQAWKRLLFFGLLWLWRLRIIVRWPGRALALLRWPLLLGLGTRRASLLCRSL